MGTIITDDDAYSIPLPVATVRQTDKHQEETAVHYRVLAKMRKPQYRYRSAAQRDDHK